MDYQKIYNRLIERARSESRVKVEGGTYYEAHHILPKCMGGEGKHSEWKTHPNIVLLTAREHFISHQLLVRIYPNIKKLQQALWFMCNQKSDDRDYKVSSRLYEQVKLIFVQSITGVKRPEGFGERMSIQRKGKPILKNRGKKRPDLAERNRSRTGLPKNIKPGWISPLKGIPQSQNLVNKRAESRKRNGKVVIRYSKDMVLLQEYRCLTDAKDWLKEHVGKGDIIPNLKGITKTAGGFIWKYKED